MMYLMLICGALRDLLPFVQFKKREKYPWRSVNFSVFFTFFKLHKWYQIAQRITFRKTIYEKQQGLHYDILIKLTKSLNDRKSLDEIVV